MGRSRKTPTVKWDKIKGVKGEIVRFKSDTPTKEILEFFGKRQHKQLYVGIDDDVLYTYFTILS